MATLADQFLESVRNIPPETTQINLPPVQPPPPDAAQYAREGVPLDVTTGVPFMKRAVLSFQATEDQKLSFLRRAYQGATVEPAGDNFVIRDVIDPSTGKRKDMLVDEQGLDFSDIADLADIAPQIAGEILISKGLGIPKRVASMGRIGRVATESTAAATGSQTAAALAESFVRLGTGEEIDGTELLTRRTSDALRDAALGGVIGGTLEAGAFLRDASRGRLTGVMSPGTEERQGIQSLRNIESDTGITFKPTIGQMAQDENVLALESFMSRIPFFGRPFHRMMKAQEDATRELQRKLMGNQPVTPLQDLGAGIVQTIQAEVKQPGEAARMAENAIAQRGADELESAIVKMAPSALKLTPEVTSDLLKYTTHARHNEFRNVADNLFSEVGNPSIPTTPLRGLLKEVEKAFPSAPIEIPPNATLESLAEDFGDEVEALLVDASGRPLVTDKGERVVKELVPQSLLRLVAGLKKLGPEVPLDQLRTVRNTLDNAIVEGRGLEDIGLRQLKQVRHALTETIEEGAGKLEGAVGPALKRANAFYRENIETFEDPFVARMLKDNPTDPGFIPSFQLMDAIRANPDTFRTVERFLKSSLKESGSPIGQTSEKTFNLLRRSILEDIYRRSARSPGAGRFIDAKAFRADLESFKPDIQAALLGVDEKTVTKNLDLLAQLKEGFEDVPVDDLNAFMRFPSNSVQDLSRLATARKKQRELFQNEIVSKLFKGDPNIDVNSIRTRSDEAVDWLVNAKNESDVSQFMALLGDNPDVVEKLRANTVADFFQEVAQQTRPADAAKTDATHLVNPTKLIDALKDPERSRRLRIIMGQSNFNVLDNFATAQVLLGKKAGQTLVGSQSRISILKDVSVLLRNLPDTARYVLYSKIFTDKNLQRMIFEGALEPAMDVSTMTRLLVNSPPILNAFAEEYGKTGAEMIIQGIRSALGSESEPEPQAAPAGSRTEQFLRAIDQPQ